MANKQIFGNTFMYLDDTISIVKTPQYIIYFYYPHSKIPSPKRQLIDDCLFFAIKCIMNKLRKKGVK